VQAIPVRNNRTTPVDLTRPRTVLDVLRTAASLYLRHGALLLLVALVVVAPYDLIVLAITQSAPLGQESASLETVIILEALALALVEPLIAALAVHVVATVGAGERPRLVQIVPRVLRVLPVVVAAEIIAWLCVIPGLLLIIPGVYLGIRWAVVAQVAATERTDWPGALRRSGELAAGNYLRIFAVLIFLYALSEVLLHLGVALAGTRSHPGAVILGIAVDTVSESIKASVIAVLYYDLRARRT
jgi:hypothetical protein